MEVREKIEMLEEMLDLEESTLEADTKLSEVEEWDSIAHLSLIVLLEDEFGKTVSGSEIRALKSVSDILGLME